MVRIILTLLILLLEVSLSRGFAARSSFYRTSFSSTTTLNMSDDDNNSNIPTTLDPAETAFVMIEYQNEFCTPGGKFHEAVKPCMEKTNMLENSAAAVNAARAAGCTIIHCPIDFSPGHPEIAKKPYGILAGIKEGEAFTAGGWGAEFANVMRPKVGEDLVVKGKSGLCGFASTNLEFLLGQSGAKNVVLGGFLTNCCVESTMRSAYEKGYKVFTLKDCVAATSIEAQDAALEYNFGMFSVPTSSKEVLAALKAPVTVA